MDYLKASIFAIAACVLGVSAAIAADETKVEELIVCAVTEIHACELYQGCRELKPSETNAPDFMKINLKDMELTGRRYDGTYATLKIATKTRLPKLLLLQGINAEPDELKDGLAYNMAIQVDTGRMAASVTSTETVYSLLGTCHAL